MISSLSGLVSIPSVVSEASGDRPFGENVHKAFKYMLDLASKEGFDTFNADNYGGHIDFKGRENGIAGIVGHLDVVPEGDGWEFDPYGGEIIDGRICGRGTMDDKGPVIASFYAMKALKECGYEPARTVRMILGLDEETNWYGMEHYLEKVREQPDFAFTPDGDFPAIHGEKGILVFDIVKKFSMTADTGLVLRSVKGGTAANCVADYARAVLSDKSGSGYDIVRQKAAEFKEKNNYEIKCRGVGRSLEITIYGVSAHGARPEQGKNAVSMMMEFLGTVNFASDDTNEFISFYNSCIGYDIHGERIGCGLTDEESGKLVFNVGMMEADTRTAKITVNIRYPVTVSDEQVYEGMMSVLDRYDLGIVKGKHQLPIYMPEDAPLITELMRIYRKHTGDMQSRPLVIGGGTYARAVKNTIAFGARFPGETELAHQKNESISIDNMVKLAEIYAETIYRLSEMR